MHNELLATRGRLRIAAGNTDAGIADLRELADRERRWRRDVPACMPWRSSLALALAQRSREEAVGLAREEVELARIWGTPRATGVALTALGRTRGGAEGQRTLQDAIAVLDGSEAPLELARAELTLGSELRHAGERKQARPVLERSVDRALRCGALRIAREAREELQATGARPRRLMVLGRDALTPT
jgi:hypothetical protein